MDENNTMHFSCEPMGDYPPSNGQGAPSGDPKKPEKKGKITGKKLYLTAIDEVIATDDRGCDLTLFVRTRFALHDK